MPSIMRKAAPSATANIKKGRDGEAPAGKVSNMSENRDLRASGQPVKPPYNSLKTALGYIAKHRQRRYLFPLGAGKKGRPLIKDNLAQASNDPVQIKEWSLQFPRCWWGLSVKKSGIVAVDIDMGPGKEGKASVQALLDAKLP